MLFDCRITKSRVDPVVIEEKYAIATPVLEYRLNEA
jgi:hypothetical protein